MNKLLTSLLLAVPVTVTAQQATSLGSFPVYTTAYTDSVIVGNSSALSYPGNRYIVYWDNNNPKPTFNISQTGNKYTLKDAPGLCLASTGGDVSMQNCDTTDKTQQLSITVDADNSFTFTDTDGACVQTSGHFGTLTSGTCNSTAEQKFKVPGFTLPTPTAVSTTPSGAVPANYHLTFHDEFTSLNTISDVDGGDANTKWFSHTIQCCMDDSTGLPGYMEGKDNSENPYSIVPDGLQINLHKRNNAWYSGVLATVDSHGNGFSQKYGYYEMLASIPDVDGTWPSFWAVSTSSRDGSNGNVGEIDIMEAYTQFKNYYNITDHDYTPNASTNTPFYYTVGNDKPIAKTTTGFHKYGMLWTADTMKFYFDDMEVYSHATPTINQQAYFPIIDLGLGGGWPTDHTPSDNAMVIKYVRVYAAN